MIKALFICVLLSACNTQPTPFQTGREISTPLGCVEARSRGHEC